MAKLMKWWVIEFIYPDRRFAFASVIPILVDSKQTENKDVRFVDVVMANSEKEALEKLGLPIRD